MANKVLLPVVLGLSFGLVFLVVFIFVHRLRTRRKRSIIVEINDRKRSSASETSSVSKLLRSKSTIRNEIPKFVIPGTHIKLVQPAITPPEKVSKPYRKESTVRRPSARELEEAGEFADDEEFRPRMLTQPAMGLRRGGSFIDGRGGVPRKLSVHDSQRSSSAGVLFSEMDSPPDPDEEYTSSPLASSSPKSKKKSHSRNASVSSIDLLSINVPPTTRPPAETVEDSGSSSRQSPEDSPRLFRIFRQSKHQIRLTGATVEFSLQYEIGKRTLVLNIMRVRKVSIPADRKHDAKICLSIHLKPDKFIWEDKTKIVQGQENPMFGEMFTISGFSLSKLHDCALLFRLQDININQTIGEVTYSLRDLQPDVLTSRTCQLQRPLNIMKDKDRSYVGDLLVSMDYDPTNWKLNVRIIRARGLPKMGRGGHTDSFVKINVHQDLNRIYKRKTRVQRHEWNPEYDEGFDFELTREQMDVTSITMNVLHRGKIRDHLIGVVLVGFNMDPNETGYQHWAMMLDKPNLSIEQWHKIYPVLK